tara:strand:- start:2011 stop:2931 length:921 start_codon:yes stop_codon:yes gene_type:complete
MSLPPSIKWAADKHYFHHSNPASRPICRTLFEKCVIRPKVTQAWAVIKGDKVGDVQAAKATINLYKDDNANMLAGRVVQDCANLHLIDGHTVEAAIRQGMSRLDEYQPRTWDDGKDERKLAVNRAEFADVLTNAIEGVKEAHAHYGLNRIDGESEIFTNLSGLELPYSGFPDFSRRIELKTKWSSAAANTKSGKRAASLPTQPDWSHVCQVAGYWAGTGLMQTIVYANAKDYRVFNADNSDRLTNDGLQAALNHITAKCAIRENILKSADSVEQMLRLIEPDFGHMWAWDMRPEVLNEAKKLWGFR